LREFLQNNYQKQVEATCFLDRGAIYHTPTERHSDYLLIEPFFDAVAPPTSKKIFTLHLYPKDVGNGWLHWEKNYFFALTDQKLPKHL
jgi:hypothetical protein